VVRRPVHASPVTLDACASRNASFRAFLDELSPPMDATPVG